MTQQYDLAAAFVAALTGDPETVMDFRALHDSDLGVYGQNKRGALRDAWPWLCAMNNEGFGIFAVIAALDGAGQTMGHVVSLRANYLDLDGADAQQQYEIACRSHPAPSFAVCSSASKYHVYWSTAPYADRIRFSTVQRKLAAAFHGDRKVIDATRVMRLPGTLHQKTGIPLLVTCHSLAGYGTPTTIDALEAALAHVVVPEGGDGARVPLGEGEQAPSLEWLQRGLDLIDPNDLDRDQWLGITTAVKQSGWTLTTPDALEALWQAWCSRYDRNDVAENRKAWKSIDSTQLDWRAMLKRVPSLAASVTFGTSPAIQPVPALGYAAPDSVPPMPANVPPPLDCSGEYLTHLECEEYFKGCVSIISTGKIMTPLGEFLNQSQFNQAYGGKQFIITGDGKKTDEPWKAATRSTLWTVPRVNHTRFLPQQPPGCIVKDVLGRTGVNIYIPPEIAVADGDPTPFLAHMALVIPDQGDRDILYDWMAHIVKFPGYKIPWAPVIQSAEGVGKGLFKELMTYAVGQPYVHFPNAQELADSGGKFNAWMRNRIFILADEINVGDKVHMIEVLKPLISERLIEVQAKGADQQMEDNTANWGFFTNYKGAVPARKNGRRYAMFFSPFQSEADLLSAGMDDAYFNRIFGWLNNGGAAIMTKWLRDRPIERGAIPMRAPKTTSWNEALSIGRSPIERTVEEAVQDGLTGFRGGWVSSIAAINRCKALGVVSKAITPQTLGSVLADMGYIEAGRADRAWMQEDHQQRATLYSLVAGADIRSYGAAQGYE